MKLNWTRKGRQRLQQIYDYIAEDQPTNALHFIDQITERVKVLLAHPRSGVKVEKYQRDDIREIYEGRYRIIYRVKGSGSDLPLNINRRSVNHL